jgi:hypothetical protein
MSLSIRRINFAVAANLKFAMNEAICQRDRDNPPKGPYRIPPTLPVVIQDISEV